MRQDGPTAPNLGRQEPSASAESQTRSERLIWPGTDDRRRRPVDIREASSGSVSALAFGVSLGANLVLLVALAGLLLLGQAGLFSSGGAFGSSTRGVTRSSPTTTSSPSATAALQIAPSSVQLGCASGQRTQYVTLQNTSSTKVSWQATLSVPAQQAGVTVSPQRGDLAAGGSAPIQVQNTTRSTGPQWVSGRQGVITFAPLPSEDSQDAGPDGGSPARLSYTTVGCH